MAAPRGVNLLSPLSWAGSLVFFASALWYRFLGGCLAVSSQQTRCWRSSFRDVFVCVSGIGWGTTDRFRFPALVCFTAMYGWFVGRTSTALLALLSSRDLGVARSENTAAVGKTCFLAHVATCVSAPRLPFWSAVLSSPGNAEGKFWQYCCVVEKLREPDSRRHVRGYRACFCAETRALAEKVSCEMSPTRGLRFGGGAKRILVLCRPSSKQRRTTHHTVQTGAIHKLAVSTRNTHLLPALL